MLYLARILSTAEDATPGVEPDSTKKGWLQVVFKGEIRLARPCYGWSSFTPPTDLWIKKYADKFGVWVATEMTNDVEESQDHLVYVGFDPYEDTLPADILAAFPEKKLVQTDRWEFVVDDGAAGPSVVLRYKGDPSTDTNPHPDDGVGTEVLRISQEDGAELIRLKKVAPGGATTEVLISQDEIEVKLDSGASLKVVGKESATIATIGDGTNHVAIVEHLQAQYTALKDKLDAFDAHIHQTGVGPSGPPTPLVAAAAWDSAINSTKVKIPDG